MKLIYSDSFKIDDAISKQMYAIIANNMSDIVASDSTYNIWLNNCIKNSSIKTIICFIDNIVIGYLQYTYNNKDIVLSEIQILKEYQGTGVFKRLLKEFVSKINISSDSIITISNRIKDGYIDHQSSACEGENIQIFESEKDLEAFIFDDEAYIVGDNDNH